jgi:hypothetical protein
MKFRFFILFLFSLPLWGAEYTEGRLRLVIHPDTGRFSLYSLEEDEPIALFSD